MSNYKFFDYDNSKGPKIKKKKIQKNPTQKHWTDDETARPTDAMRHLPPINKQEGPQERENVGPEKMSVTF